MRTALLFPSLSLCGIVYAQVQVDGSIGLTGPAEERHIEGLAPPVDGSALITVDVLASGSAYWGSAAMVGDTITLTMTPAVTTPVIGTLIRFLPPSTNEGPRWIRLNGLATVALLGTYGERIPPGALRANLPAEVYHTGSNFVLLNANSKNCPPGTLATTGPTCVDINSIPGLRFYQAIEHCAGKGGKLCTWDEYAVGCALGGTQLEGLFNEWEWIDDTSNHTHTANQAGRFSCQSQRSANVITTMTGDTRCCYRKR